MGQGGYPGKAQSTGYRTDRIQRAVRHHGRFKALGTPSRQRFSRQHDCERKRRSRCTRCILKENGNFKNVDTAMPVESLDDLEQYRSDRLTDKVTSLKDSLDAQYKADERGRVFDRPCQVLDDGDLDEH